LSAATIHRVADTLLNTTPDTRHDQNMNNVIAVNA